MIADTSTSLTSTSLTSTTLGSTTLGSTTLTAGSASSTSFGLRIVDFVLHYRLP